MTSTVLEIDLLSLKMNSVHYGTSGLSPRFNNQISPWEHSESEMFTLFLYDAHKYQIMQPLIHYVDTFIMQTIFCFTFRCHSATDFCKI